MQLLVLGPCKVNLDGIMVTQNITIVLEEHVANVLKLGGLERHGSGSAVPDLVDDFAVERGGRVAAEQGVSAGGWLDPSANELDPGVGHAVCGPEDGRVVACTGVACVGVAEDEDGVAGGVGFDVVGDLL